MNSFTHVPPGFRFHPTDEELVDYYLRKKISSGRIDLDVIQDIDLYKIEPWDLQEKCKIGTKEQSEWYFFSHKDKKYPTGTRTNRATTVGFWKATGRDKAIYCKHSLVGMRKTLVFYEGRAPNGQKSDYIMHEYRLETNENAAPQEEGWVVCRVFKKRIPTVQRGSEHDSPCWYDEHVSFMPPQVDCSKRFTQNIDNTAPFNFPYSAAACKKELTLQYHNPFDSFLQLPQLESPSKVTNSSKASVSFTTLASYGLDMNRRSTILDSSSSLSSSSSILKQEEMQQYLNLLYDENNNDHQQAVDQVTDWRVLEKFVASQLSQNQQDHISNKEVPIEDYSDGGGDGCNASNDHMNNLLSRQSNNEELAPPPAECASTSTSSIDLWK